MSEFVCIFEDEKVVNFHPLTFTKPLFELRVGILTIREKYQNLHPEKKYFFHMRNYLAENYKEWRPNYLVNDLPDTDKTIVFINSRLIPERDLFELFLDQKNSKIFLDQNNYPVAACLKKDDLPEDIISQDYFDLRNIENIPYEKIDCSLFHYPWELVNNNGEELIKDFNLLTEQEIELVTGKIYEGAHLLNRDSIYISPTAVVKPGVVLDAENGPIYIDDDAEIFPNAVIEGPAYIGSRTKIKIGAKIYENTSIGKVCKVGGEVEESIIHSFSNKQHDGFLGHAYLGQWVNLGADTNNSDLKNNYGNVRVTINGETIDTGSTFVGLIMGDHSKSGINTMFNTGTVVGVGCNIYGSNFPPKYIPSFCWGGSDGLVTHKFDKFIKVAQIVMARRNVELQQTQVDLYKEIYDRTYEERIKIGIQA